MSDARKAVLFLSLLLIIPVGAQANVVYNWQPETGGQYAQAVSGQIVVTDQAYRSGSLSVDYTFPYSNVDFGGPFGDAILDSPIVSAGMGFDFYEFGGFDGAFVEPPANGFGSEDQDITATLTFEDEGFLSGDMDIFGFTMNFDSAGSGRDWQVSDVNSDFFTGAGRCTGNFDTPCSGGTGFWALDSTTVPMSSVPSPAVWSLFGLAVLGVFGVGRARTRNV